MQPRHRKVRSAEPANPAEWIPGQARDDGEDSYRALAHFQAVGAKLYRGPMEIDAAE